MTKLIIIFIQIFVLPTIFFTTTLGQSDKSIAFLKKIIHESDTVVIISHKVTAEYMNIVREWDEETHPNMTPKKWKKLQPAPLTFLKNGNINKAIIVETLKLNDSNRTILANVLLRQVFLESITPVKCNIPQHSILFYKKSNLSFIDICFSCMRINSSKDIDFTEFNMDEDKWAYLALLFTTNGLTRFFERSVEEVEEL